MESQTQNPEFRNNPEKFYPCGNYIILFSFPAFALLDGLVIFLVVFFIVVVLLFFACVRVCVFSFERV